MNILMLAEGDAETPNAFSGIGRSLLASLREQGHTVVTGDCDLSGMTRLAAAALTWSPRRPRWVSKYHTSAWPFRQRSRRAGRHIRARAEGLDAILQIGATFRPENRADIPYFLYCDANFRLGQGAPNSWAASLAPHEVERVVDRERGVYDDATGIFTLSERARQSFLTDFGLPESRVVTVHAGPNIDPAEIPRDVGQRRCDDTPTVLFVGREWKRKGGDLLVRAFEIARQRVPNARLCIVGPRDVHIATPGVENLGLLRRDNPAEWRILCEAYSSASVFCLATRFEPFGIVFLEAMLFGLPCIATDAWAIPEIIVEGKTGYRVPLEDVDALADRLVLLLSDPALARRLGEAGRARVERHFTWAAVASKMTAGMERLLARGPDPGPK